MRLSKARFDMETKEMEARIESGKNKMGRHSLRALSKRRQSNIGWRCGLLPDKRARKLVQHDNITLNVWITSLRASAATPLICRRMKDVVLESRPNSASSVL